jgi:tyrosine-protein phosphatase YwqE
MGVNGERELAEAVRLLNATPVVAIASDAHGTERPPAIRPALDALARLGVPAPRRLAEAIPNALLEHGIPPRSATVAA